MLFLGVVSEKEVLAPDILRILKGLAFSEKIQACELGDLTFVAAARGKTNLSRLFWSDATDTSLSIFYGYSDNLADLFISNGRNAEVLREGVTANPARLLRQLISVYSPDILGELSGSFFAVSFDSREDAVQLYGDPVGGLVTLYYSSFRNRLVFSTNYQLLIRAARIDGTIDSNSLKSFFATGYVLPPKTMLRGVNKLCPGELVTWRNGRLSKRQLKIYQHLTNGTMKHDGSAGLIDYLSMYLRKLDALQPNKIFLLSGGIDSSTLVTLAAQIAEKKIDTATAAFQNTNFDESYYANVIAKKTGVNSIVFNLSGPASLDDLPSIIYFLGDPNRDFSVIPTYHLFKKIAEAASMVICADGPDHLFGRYYQLAVKRFIGKRLGCKVDFLKHVGWAKTMEFGLKVKRAGRLDLLNAYLDLFLLPIWGFENLDKFGFLSETRAEGDSEVWELYRPHTDEKASFEATFNEVALIDFYLDGTLGVFNKVGKMAAANDLVVREPYLSRDVIEFIVGLPFREKVRGDWYELLTGKARTKYHLKYRIGESLLPREIILKRKQGFVPPLADWLRKKYDGIPYNRAFCEESLKNCPLTKKEIKRVWSEFGQGNSSWTELIYMLISWDLWYRINLVNHEVAPPTWTLSDVIE